MGAKIDGLSDAICHANRRWHWKPTATVTQILGILLHNCVLLPDMQAMCTHSSSQLNTLYWQAWRTVIASPPCINTNMLLTRPDCEGAIIESIVPQYFHPTFSETDHNAFIQSKTICLHYSMDESSSFEGYLSKQTARPYADRKSIEWVYSRK